MKKKSGHEPRYIFVDEFDRLYDSLIVERLAPMGFARRSRSAKSIDLVKGKTIVSLLRKPRRTGSSGFAFFNLCFRHSFLGVEEVGYAVDVEGLASLHYYDYPYSFRPKDLLDGQQLRFMARKYEFGPEDYPYCSRSASEVRSYLTAMASYIAETFVPWALKMSPAKVCSELRAYAAANPGPPADQCVFWISEYERHLKRGRK